MKPLFLAAAFSIGCAATQPHRPPPPPKAPEPLSAEATIALSRVLETAASPRLGTVLESTFRFGHAIGALDGLHRKRHMLDQYNRLSCLASLEKMEGRFDKNELKARAGSCNQWVTPDRRGTGASRYAASRLEVARRGTQSPEIAALQMNAFDAGYTNALGEHQLPTESEVSGESARVCVATLKDAMITDFEAACTSVVLEVCASHRKAAQLVGPPPPP